jgi:hypothetical protein
MVRSLKLKGMGLGNADGTGVPPPLGKYHHRRLHIGISDDGDVRTVWPETAPMGGIFFDRARLEFENSRLLASSGCPSVVPVALYRYKDLRCDWNPSREMGAVLTASPTLHKHRLDLLFECDRSCSGEASSVLNGYIESLGNGDKHKAFARLAFEYARTLREFHEAGLFRHNAHPINVIYSDDIERVCLIDLDSSRQLVDCAPARRPMELLRDFASAVYSFIDVMIRPENISMCGPSAGPSLECLLALAHGYFREDAEAAGDQLGDAFSEYLVEIHDEAFQHRIAPTCCARGMHPRGPIQPDLEYLYPKAMSAVVRSYEKSSLMSIHPLAAQSTEIESRLASAANRGGD